MVDLVDVCHLKVLNHRYYFSLFDNCELFNFIIVFLNYFKILK